MTQPVQTRSRRTRAALVDAARSLVAKDGYEALRVEDVVAQAGVAKGTFFAHFTDKDGILTELMGAELTEQLDQMEQAPAPTTPRDTALRMSPVVDYLARERTVFDIVMRYSGGMGPTGNPIIADGITRQITILSGWIAQAAAIGQMRNDQDPALLAEGVQAFVAQVLALHFCSEEGERHTPTEELIPFLVAWLGVR